MSIYRGFSTVNNNFGPYVVTDQNIIVQDFINQLNIRKGEIPHRSQIGCIIWDLLFGPLTTSVQNQMTSDITRIAAMDPRITDISSISATSIDSGVQITCQLYLASTNQTINLVLAFDSSVGTVIIN